MDQHLLANAPSVAEPAWYPSLESGGLPPEPPEPVGDHWRPDDDWWLLIALGMQVAIIAFTLIIDVMEARGMSEHHELVKWSRKNASVQ